MINYFGFIISFLLGYFYHKKRDDLLTFIKSIILLFKIRKRKNYNEFFECNFNDNDFYKEVDNHDE